MKRKVPRLFESFKPSNYQLDIKLDREAMTFSGEVIIKGHKTGRPAKRLVLHQKDLVIESASVIKHSKEGQQTVVLDRINTHSTLNELRLHSQENFVAGEYTVLCKFRGIITEQMNGLYPCLYDEGGKRQKLLATQFESHHAREVFPCIDEPEAKATFDLSISAPAGETILSNTPAKTTKTANGLQTVTFGTTPKMSTYLVAFVCGYLKYKESQTKRGTLVRTYATPDNVKLTDFALDCAVKCLEFFEDYFDIPYPLEKCDLVALPDFSNGAMENWGLITFREQCLYVDPKNTSLGVKQFVAMVVAHELAHQWFGNLVTMRWWTDLWLNEGFASWVEYLAVDHLFPEWEMWVQFIATEQQPAMKLDALDNTHAIEVPVKHPDEIHSIFDTISYSKGASVIHMLHGYLGQESFRDGLRHYLRRHSYSNTDTKDLWQALEEVSKLPVKHIMHAWTSQPGFPLVQAVKDNNKLHLSQQRFYIHKPDIPDTSLWPVPILSDGISLARLDKAQAEIELDNSKPVKINQGESGFYRTIYDRETLSGLAKEVESGRLAELDRLGILSDSFETAKAGMIDIADAMKLLTAYKTEENSAVWDIIAANIGEIRRAMDDNELRELLKPYVIKLTAKELKRLSWQENTTDSHFDKLLRPTILGLASAAEEPGVIKEALRRFESMKTPEDIPADLRSVVYVTAAHHGDRTTFNKLLKLHDGTTSSEEKTTVCMALTNFKQSELVEKALSFIKTDRVRKQDAMYWVAYTLGNFHGKQSAWEWLKDNWQWLSSKLGRDLSFYRTPIYVARSFSSKGFLREYTEFFAAHTTPALERSVRQGIEILSWQIDWKQRDLKKLKDFLK